MKIWPDGYLQKEIEYCRNEYEIFSKEDSEDWRKNHRKAVLDKREEFRIKWNKEHKYKVEA